MDLARVNPLDHPGWDDLLLTNRQSSFFHTTHWARVLRDSYGYTPVYFARIDDGKLETLIPVMDVRSPITGKRGVSLPFTDYSSPVVNGRVAPESLLDEVKEHAAAAGWESIEIRGGESLFPEPGAPSSAIFAGHKLALHPDVEAVFRNIGRGMRSSLKKGMREGVEVSLCNTAESVDAFCRLNCLTRKGHGLPPQPRRFFRNIHENVISKNLGFVSLASYGGRPIAAAMFFHFNGKGIYKYGASDRAYQEHRPNNLTMWEAIRWYCDHGFRELCFGRSDFENKGLIQFKNSWGAEQGTIPYYRYDTRRKTIVAGGPGVTGFHNRIFRNLPMPVLKGIGTILYRHLG